MHYHCRTTFLNAETCEMMIVLTLAVWVLASIFCTPFIGQFLHTLSLPVSDTLASSRRANPLHGRHSRRERTRRPNANQLWHRKSTRPQQAG